MWDWLNQLGWAELLALGASPEVRHVALPVPPGAPMALRGRRLVQLSDLHLSHWNRGVLEQAIARVNQIQPDAVVITGDFITKGPQYLPDLTALLRRLTPPTWACLGNHDHDDGDHGRAVRRALTRAEVRPLVNEAEVLRLAAGPPVLTLAGLDDALLGRPCLGTLTHALARAQEKAGATPPLLLLNHNPQATHHYVPSLPASWILSGHTHGGQIRLPRALQTRLFRSPYVAGHYVLPLNRSLYVNQGLGVAVWVKDWLKGRRLRLRSAIPTLRAWVRPELTLFEFI
jgi:hypothetical protein